MSVTQVRRSVCCIGADPAHLAVGAVDHGDAHVRLQPIGDAVACGCRRGQDIPLELLNPDQADVNRLEECQPGEDYPRAGEPRVVQAAFDLQPSCRQQYGAALDQE
jgi:hypothetical protein